MQKSADKKELVLVKPFMPPVADLIPFFERIWESRQLTNSGPVHAEFEQALCRYLGVSHISLIANGTLALMIALKTLRLRGEVITTPFTSPATLQAICWNNLKPVFADIHESDLNMDPSAIEAAITGETCAILPVHIFGRPCDIEGIRQIAHKHNLKVIYDAAHCFGVEKNGDSICNYGDLSTLSFHATKVFNTLEGGAIICHDEATKKMIDTLTNIGHDADPPHPGYGLNAKMNEIQSAVGICGLNYAETIIAGRKAATLLYRGLLKDLHGIKMMDDLEGVRHNYSYFPIIIDSGEFGAGRDELYDHLKSNKIISRKYFYPLASDYPAFERYKTHNLPVAENIAENILCIPLFHDITTNQIETVVYTIKELYHPHRIKTYHENFAVVP